MKVAVIGGGMWGRALSYAFSQKNDVGIVSRKKLTNLKESKFKISQIDFSYALKAKYLIIAIKSNAIRNWLEENKIENIKSTILVASKGIDMESGEFVFDIFSKYQNLNIGYLMGPSFATEVLENRPCALNIHTIKNIQDIKEIFPDFMKIYFDDDVVGGGIAGAYKNIIAIAAGICDGLSLGNNAKAGMMARGLVEMCRFGVHFGAKEKTFIGLSGAGDLFLSANSTLSRNYKVGIELAKNKNLDSIIKSLTEVAEGIYTTKAVLNISKKHNIYTPIANEINEILNGKNPRDSIKKLLQ